MSFNLGGRIGSFFPMAIILPSVVHQRLSAEESSLRSCWAAGTFVARSQRKAFSFLSQIEIRYSGRVLRSSEGQSVLEDQSRVT